MSKTYVLIRRSYDYYEFNDVLHAGTLNQCMKKAKKIWSEAEEIPACYIEKEHFGKVYSEYSCPEPEASFLMILEFKN